MLLKKLVASADWGSIYAVSRHEDPDLKGTRVKHLPLNLLEEQVYRGNSVSTRMQVWLRLPLKRAFPVRGRKSRSWLSRPRMSRMSSTLHSQARLVPFRSSLLEKLHRLCNGVSISYKLVGSAQQGQGITSTCCCGRLQCVLTSSCITKRSFQNNW